MTTWTPPDPEALYICRDEDGTPSRMCRYVDLLSEIDTDLWPHDEDAFDLLMFAYNAEPTRERE